VYSINLYKKNGVRLVRDVVNKMNSIEYGDHFSTRNVVRTPTLDSGTKHHKLVVRSGNNNLVTDLFDKIKFRSLKNAIRQ